MSGLKVVSWSEIQYARRCAFKHQVGYVERWQGEKDPMSALGKGTAWHLVMETHYSVLRDTWRKYSAIGDGVLQRKLLNQCRSEVSKVIVDMPDELAEVMWWAYDGYVSYYGADPQWTVLAVEHAAQCRLPTPKMSASGFILKMKIDLIVRERVNGRLRVVDHKFEKDLPHRKSLELDDQFGLYTWGLRQLGREVFGQTYNSARSVRLVADVKDPGTTPLDERFHREPMYRTDKELDRVAVEAYLTASARYAEAARLRRMEYDAPRTFDKTRCSWDCDWTEACLAGRKGLDWRSFMNAKGFYQQTERH